MKFFVTSAKGLEDLVAAELQTLGIAELKVERGGVSFNGELEDGCKACLWLRTASRVLQVLAEFPCASPDELYAGIMIHKAGEDPQQILSASPAAVAYAIGASSGESAAKAATGGKASIGVASHGAAVEALVSGKAKAAVVKDSWWQSNQDKYKGLKSYDVPKVSEKKNPDNVLTASSEVPAVLADKIKAAALSSSAAFGKGSMKPFANAQLNFSLGLMMQGKIDPLSYKW